MKKTKNESFLKALKHLIEEEKVDLTLIADTLGINVARLHCYIERKESVDDIHHKKLFEEYKEILSKHAFME